VSTTAESVVDSAASKHLDRALVRRMAWTGGINWASQLVAWVCPVVVLRLLVPEDYGLVAVAVSFTSLVAVFNEAGGGITVVTLRHLSDQVLVRLNTCAVMIGLLGLALPCAAAISLGSFFHSLALPGLLCCWNWAS
jgi:PST family polysaccharide transporter